MGAFCDWLDVTYSPISFPSDSVSMFLQSSGASLQSDDGKTSAWRVGDGLIRFESRSRYARISASGSALAFLRMAGVFNDYLSSLATCAHTVTRLDAALDVLRDGADTIAELRTRFPISCTLSRKGQRVSSLLAPRDSDGRETGTWYVGHRAKGEVTARVYDKAHEAWQKRGEKLPPTTRYEITVRKGYQPTLRDAAEPDRIFWHFASPTLLEAPPHVPEWSSGWGNFWQYELELPPVGAIIQKRIDYSPDFNAVAKLAASHGEGYERLAVNAFEKLLKGYRADASASAALRGV